MAEVTGDTKQTVPTISSSNVKLDESGTLSGPQDVAPKPSMSGDFTNIPLVDDDKLAKAQKKKKEPRRIIHFTSGETMEEYSTDEEEEEEAKPKIDPKQLKWMQWLWYHFVLAGTKSLKIADFCGEKFAWMLGITSPKYQYALDELERIQREEEEEKARDEREQAAIRAREAAEIAELEGGVGVDSVYKPNIGQANPAYEITEDEEKDMKKSEDKVSDDKDGTKKF